MNISEFIYSTKKMLDDLNDEVIETQKANEDKDVLIRAYEMASDNDLHLDKLLNDQFQVRTEIGTIKNKGTLDTVYAYLAGLYDKN